MHPFGGSPKCPRCDKAVYAAEQTMGPGRKLYHKPCLACTICNKRLDSFTLLEHDQQPYCKNCHVKNFGTRDLRQANLPQAQRQGSATPESVTSDLPTSSPARSNTGKFQSPMRTGARSPSPITGNGRTTSPTPILRPNRTFSPTSTTFPTKVTEEEDEKGDTVDTEAELTRSASPTYDMSSTNVGRTGTGFPRTVPLSPSKTGLDSAQITPLKQTSTGTRYGAALGGGGTPSPVRQWGGGTPQCGRCGKSVYFAEQVKATGKVWHKGCLRCTECSTSLDSKKLTEKDGNPLCHRCYSKLHGPQGSGYALLGKAGG